MKNLRLLIILLGLILMSFYIKDDTTELYERSLYEHIHKISVDSVYILKSPDIVDLSSRINNIHIINISDSTQSFLLKQKGRYVVKLMPINVNKGNIEICIIDYTLEEEKGRIIFSNEGSKVYVYHYIGKGKYILVRKK